MSKALDDIDTTMHMGDDEFEMDYVVDAKIEEDGTRMFLIKWTNCDHS